MIILASQLAVKTRKHGTKGSSCASAIDRVYLLAPSVNFLRFWVICKEQRFLRKVVPGARRRFNSAGDFSLYGYYFLFVALCLDTKCGVELSDVLF